METARPKCFCIYVHKPNIKEFKIGDKWKCPTCGKEHTRIEEKKGTLIAVWESQG